MSQAIKQYDFTREEIKKLFQMQDTLNSYIHPEWKTQGFSWGLAIVDECMEIHGHLGWKWWKDGYKVGLTEENRKQIQLEVIDILHFVISDNSTNGYHLLGMVDRFNGRYFKETLEDILRCIMDVAIECIVTVDYWVPLAHSVGLTKQQILETYTQKYVLNKFRQDHGYKDGSYQKLWQLPEAREFDEPYEDNEALELVVNTLRQGNHSTTDENLLYSELKALYNSRLNQ